MCHERLCQKVEEKFREQGQHQIHPYNGTLLTKTPAGRLHQSISSFLLHTMRQRAAHVSFLQTVASHVCRSNRIKGKGRCKKGARRRIPILWHLLAHLLILEMSNSSRSFLQTSLKLCLGSVVLLFLMTVSASTTCFKDVSCLLYLGQRQRWLI